MAISFDGTSSKVVIDTTGVIDNTNAYSVNFKIQLTDTNSAYERNLSYREGSRGFMVIQEDDKLFIITNGTGGTTWGRDVDANTGVVLLGLSTGTWYNITVNFTGGADGVSSTPTVWKDGVSVTENGTGSLNGGSGPGYGSGDDTDTLHLGSRSATGSTITSPGDCIIAEVTMWESSRVIADAVAMTAGTSGSTIGAPAIHYQALTNTDTTETENSQTVTVYGSPTTATHPTMASNDITATAAISFGSSADLNAIGEMGATASLSFGSSASLTSPLSEDITAISALSFGTSADLNAIGEMSSTAALSLSTSADLGQAITAISFGSDNFDSAIFDVTGSSITDAATLTPTLTLAPEDYSDVTGWLMLCARMTACTGKTPTFVYDQTNARHKNFSAGNPVWHYLTDDRNTWYEFDNVAIASDIVTVSMNTAFTGDIEFATKPRWHYSDTQDFIAEIALDSNAHELASSVAAGSLPTNVHASVDPGATNANSFPQQDINLYGIRISNDAATPDVGDKWPVVLLMGAHASEDQGNYMLQGFVDYLLGGSAIANQLLVDFSFFIYEVNPAGRAFGRERFDESDATSTDINRAWDGTPAGTVADDIIAAIGVDVTSLKGLIDFHGAYSLSSDFGAYYDTGNPYDVNFKDKMLAKLTGGTYPSLGANPTGSAGWWGASQGALFSLTHEGKYHPTGFPSSSSMYDNQGQAIGETLSEIRTSVELGMVATAAISFGSVAELNAVGALVANSSITFTTGAELTQAGNFNLTSTAALSFGSVAGLTATGKLTANTGLSFTNSAVLNATGGLSAVSSLVFGSAAELTQATLNDIFATAGLAFGSAANISAIANITAVAPITLSTSALLSSPGVAPTVVGLHYTMTGSRVHFTMSGNPLHYTL